MYADTVPVPAYIKVYIGLMYADTVTVSAYISYRSLSLVLLHVLARVASAASWSGLTGRIVLVLVPAPG